MSTQTATAGKLHSILEWVNKEGEARASDRLRVKMMPELLGDNIHFSRIDASTCCSPETLTKFRQAAEEIVGKRCPV